MDERSPVPTLLCLEWKNEWWVKYKEWSWSLLVLNIGWIHYCRLASAVRTLKSSATRKSALVITWEELFKSGQHSTKEMDATLVNASKMDRFCWLNRGQYRRIHNWVMPSYWSSISLFKVSCQNNPVPCKCQYQGMTLNIGDTRQKDCNTCTCMASGQVQCSNNPCNCQYNGRTYSFGQTFSKGDSCNTCTCQTTGQVK